ncbi:hypothetical protein A1O3_03129 [Capronia epimyces CBS 606.96]|uniref:Het-C-domain-containing protein n=1 Tax=Capronia epimyces CBS 606.96 TaxID=1182542 RepID=W9YLD4_9EURO|nr:uncharacterized protein A1O3_03129 [Capronia epimyces CBS 606.96]EXJ90061.1 hypothetical protein A1O3_03129 [Capronia epimyces CBS 606.96]
MALSSSQIVLLCAVGIVLLAKPAHAFGAGNIGSTSKVEGENWRHGDLEDTLLTLVAARAMGGKKFSKLDVKRVYFGNWLRDYSQAVDVGTVKYVSAEAIRILLWVLGFMSFGYGSGEFEVTTERLGCYRPEEHIDNPKDYADNLDARQYDRRLRGPVDERRELSINPQTALKNYIASEGMGIDTSAGLVRKLFGRSIQLGRQYARSKNKADLYEALRLLGTGSHCLEDYAAHSNYVELALIELGERDVFPHVGRRTAIQLREVRHPVYPIVTGTFGGVDFLHSVCGEFDDKTTQSEIEELEGTMQQYGNGDQDNSILQGLLDKIPSGVFGGKDEAGKADELKQNSLNHAMESSRISPRQPEEWTQYLNDVQRQILPIIEWHDEIMKAITETIEKIPILPDLIEQLQDEINKFVFSLLAPFVVPIINQVKTELNTGSSEIINSSKDKQHIVFNDDNSSDPTHSMLAKDHFSNILNEPAGKVARQTVKWVVPQIVACWDDESIDVNRTLDRIIHGVLHHPALRDHGQDGASDGRHLMFSVVEDWWRGKSEQEKDGLRRQLSREGVRSGENHKPGVQDHGHGSNRPLAMANLNSGSPLSGFGGDAFGAIGSAFEGGNPGSGHSTAPVDKIGEMAGAAVGGGILGSLVGGLTSGLGGNLLGGGLDTNSQTYKRDSYGQDGSYTETVTEVGQSQSGDRYGQAQYSSTTGAAGGRTHEEYNRFEQTEYGGRLQSEVHHEERTSTGQYREETRRYGDGDGDDGGAYGRRPEHERHHRRGSGSHGRHHDSESYEHHRHDDGGHPRGDEGRFYGNQGQDRRPEPEIPGYGGVEGFGRHERREDYGRREDNEYGSGGGYGRQQESTYGQDQYGRREESGFGSAEYGRREEPSGGFGGPGRRRDEPDFVPGGFGGPRDEPGFIPGGFDAPPREPDFGGGGFGGFGGGREEYGSGAGRGYGGQQEYGEPPREEYGRPEGQGDYDAGYGGGDDDNEAYAQRRRYGGEDEGENEGYGGGGGYSQY